SSMEINRNSKYSEVRIIYKDLKRSQVKIIKSKVPENLEE
ncbi:45737_t:CDS:1, partial [Gigaspora margarita]